MTKSCEVVVIGAGMAGLAAAHALQAEGAAVTVLEREPRVGGRILTETVDGFTVDGGAQFLTNFYDRTLGLIREVGLQDDLVRMPMSVGLLRRGRLVPVSPPLRLISHWGFSFEQSVGLAKLAAATVRHWSALDLHALDRAAALDTRSVAEYADASLGRGVLDEVIAPTLASFLYWTPERTSQAVLLMLAAATMRLRTTYCLRGGMARLPRAVAGGLDVLLGAEAQDIRPAPAGGHEVTVREGGRLRVLRVDGVVCATRATDVLALFPELTAPQRALFEAVEYAPSATIAVALRSRLPSTFHAVMFARREARHLSMAAIQSTRGLPHTPPRSDMVFLYPAPSIVDGLLATGDESIVGVLVDDLRRAGPDYDVARAVAFSRVYRWPEATPEFGVGAVQRLRSFARERIESDQVVYAGDYLGGPSIEGAVTSGLVAARRLLWALRKQGT
jgi:oxygen-dependent protoporphyrinogen oxidase